MRYTIVTSLGSILVELDSDKAPESAKNFAGYADDGFYDGTIFHRVIDGFMVQCGGFDAEMNKKKTGKPIVNEWRNGLSNDRGTLAMARLGNQPDSATSQFFINVADNDFLNEPRDGAGYAVFGTVVEGMDVVDAIKSVDTTTKQGMGDVPIEAVVIEKVEKAD